MWTMDTLVHMDYFTTTHGCNVCVSAYFWPRVKIFNIHTSPCMAFFFYCTLPLQTFMLCVGFVVQVIDAQKRDIVSIHWTQGALSSDWLGQPPLTCPWPIRGECAVCVFVFICLLDERLSLWRYADDV